MKVHEEQNTFGNSGVGLLEASLMINKICQVNKQTDGDMSEETAGYSCSDLLNPCMTQKLMKNSLGYSNMSSQKLIHVFS